MQMGLESDERAIRATIATEARALDTALAAEGRERNTYYATGDTFFMGSDNEKVFIPEGYLRTFTADQVSSLEAKGVTGLVKVQEGGVPWDDLKPETLGTNYKEVNARSYQNTAEAFSEFGSSITYNFRSPTEYGITKGASPSIDEEEWNSITQAYKNNIGNTQRLYNQIQELHELASEGDVTGAEGALGILKERVAAITGYSAGTAPENIYQQFAKALIGDDSLSKASQYEIRSRMLLAEMAPILLGESGKTISDQDRARIAKTLGFNVEWDADSNTWSVLGFNAEILKTSPDKINDALGLFSAALARRQNEVNREMSIHARRFARMPKNYAQDADESPTSYSGPIIAKVKLT
tara:strand:- start:6 stop:1067 length:1062 start_codon:yes stop_codon:yes gene_type:complete